GARPGDALVLTKALGTGIVTTARKHGMGTEVEEAAAIESMLALNATASRTLREFAVHACTDVTGFSLLGHGFEMAHGSSVRIELTAARRPRGPRRSGRAAADATGSGSPTGWRSPPRFRPIWWSPPTIRRRRAACSRRCPRRPPTRPSPRCVRPAWRARRSWARSASAAPVPGSCSAEPRTRRCRSVSAAHRHDAGAPRGSGRRRRLGKRGVVDLEIRRLLERIELRLDGVLQLLVAQRGLDLLLHLVEGLAFALLALTHQDDVPSVLRLHGVAQLAGLQGERDPLEVGHHATLPELAEIAALRPT